MPLAKFRTPYLSIVVPVYRGEKIIVPCINKLNKVLTSLGVTYEIILVIDGQVDNAEKKAKGLKIPQLKIFAMSINRGKGYAVRFGLGQARGEIVGYADLGFDMEYSSIPITLEHMKWYKADIVVGSKRHPASKVNYPWQRRVFSTSYQLLVRTLFGLNIRDTQVGLKIFRREVIRKVLPRLIIKRYAFDVEVLSVANYLGYTKIFEAPTEIHYDFDDLTHASTIKSILRMLWDTLAVFYRLRINRYYDDKNRSAWQPNLYYEF